MNIRLGSLVIVGTLSLLAIVIVGITSYKFRVQSARDEAREKGLIVLNYANATRQYLADVQTPLLAQLLEEDRFYPELMSDFAIARETHSRFNERMPGYHFKQASLNPLQPLNKADEAEQEIIGAFRDNPALQIKEGTITKDGEKFYYLAQPIKVSHENCLKCHGDPNNAPKDLVLFYGDQNGFGWQLWDTVAAFVVYLPVKQALGAAQRSTVTLLLIAGGCIVLALLCIWFFLERIMVLPIVRLIKRAEQISVGETLEETVSVRSVAEVGALARAIDRLRVSIVLAMKRSENV